MKNFILVISLSFFLIISFRVFADSADATPVAGDKSLRAAVTKSYCNLIVYNDLIVKAKASSADVGPYLRINFIHTDDQKDRLFQGNKDGYRFFRILTHKFTEVIPVNDNSISTRSVASISFKQPCGSELTIDEFNEAANGIYALKCVDKETLEKI